MAHNYVFPTQSLRLQKQHCTSSNNRRLVSEIRSSYKPPSVVATAMASPGKIIESDKLPKDARKRAMDAVDKCGRRVTVGDVANMAGMKVTEAQKTLQAIAADTNGFLEMSGSGVNNTNNNNNNNIIESSIDSDSVSTPFKRWKRYQVMKRLFKCKMAESASLRAHALRLKGYLDQLDILGGSLQEEYATCIVLGSLPSSYGSSIMNYNLNGRDDTICKFLQMLKTAENNKSDISTSPATESSKVINDQEGRVGIPNKKRKAEEIVLALPAYITLGSKDLESDVLSYCVHCNQDGHWVTGCSDYSAERSGKADAGSSGAKEK